MDMRISGSGQITSGEYDELRVSGSASLHGVVRCESCHISGAAKGDTLECKKECKISGSGRFSQSVKADSLSVSGAFSCEGGLEVSGKLSCSGGVKCGQSIRAAELTVSGGLSAEGDIEAERVRASGKLNCGGLLNAEEIDIEFSGGMKIESIGGSKIAIYRSVGASKIMRLPLLSKLLSSSGSSVQVNTVEGDTVALEGVTANTVSGRVVAIGEGCDIALVQYSDNLEVSPGARVEKTEKI